MNCQYKNDNVEIKLLKKAKIMSKISIIMHFSKI